MQFSAFAVLLLVAGAFATQVEYDERPPNVVEQRVINAVKRYTEFLRRVGLDPIEVDSAESKRVLIQGILEVRSFIEDLELSGGSNVDLKYVNYNVPLGRLRVTFNIPELRMTIGKAGLDIKLVDNVDSIRLAGSLSIKDVNLSAEISFNANWDGITVRSITINFNIDEVESELELVVFERNYSDYLNRLAGERLPSVLERNENEINRALEAIIRRLLETFLQRPYAY